MRIYSKKQTIANNTLERTHTHEFTHTVTHTARGTPGFLIRAERGCLHSRSGGGDLVQPRSPLPSLSPLPLPSPPSLRSPLLPLPFPSSPPRPLPKYCVPFLSLSPWSGAPLEPRPDGRFFCPFFFSDNYCRSLGWASNVARVLGGIFTLKLMLARDPFKNGKELAFVTFLTDNCISLFPEE